MLKTGFLAGALALLAACSGNQEILNGSLGCGTGESETNSSKSYQEIWTDGPLQDSQGIIGGKRLTARSPLAKQVAYIQAKTKDETNACTGTLISPHVVLTARHCVEDYDLVSVKVSFGIESPCESQRGLSAPHNVELHNIRKLPLYNRFVMGNDIALLKMTEAAPRDFKPMPLSYDEFPGMVRHMFIAGFGRTTEDSTTYVPGHLKILNFEIDRRDPSNQIHYSEAGLIVVEHKIFETQIACKGDSGGPLLQYSEGQTKQIGISVAVGGEDNPNSCQGAVGFTSLRVNHAALSPLFYELSPHEKNPFDEAASDLKRLEEKHSRSLFNQMKPWSTEVYNKHLKQVFERHLVNQQSRHH